MTGATRDQGERGIARRTGPVHREMNISSPHFGGGDIYRTSKRLSSQG